MVWNPPPPTGAELLSGTLGDPHTHHHHPLSGTLPPPTPHPPPHPAARACTLVQTPHHPLARCDILCSTSWRHGFCAESGSWCCSHAVHLPRICEVRYYSGRQPDYHRVRASCNSCSRHNLEVFCGFFIWIFVDCNPRVQRSEIEMTSGILMWSGMLVPKKDIQPLPHWASWESYSTSRCTPGIAS